MGIFIHRVHCTYKYWVALSTSSGGLEKTPEFFVQICLMIFGFGFLGPFVKIVIWWRLTVTARRRWCRTPSQVRPACLVGNKKAKGLFSISHFSWRHPNFEDGVIPRNCGFSICAPWISWKLSIIFKCDHMRRTRFSNRYRLRQTIIIFSTSKTVSFCQTLYFALQNRHEDIFDFVNQSIPRVLVIVIVWIKCISKHARFYF